MNILNISFLLMAFAVATAVVYMVVLILRRWYFNLSPKETASFALIMFLLGFIVSAYLTGNFLYVLFPSLVLIGMFAWWMYRASKRRAVHRSLTRAGMGVNSSGGQRQP